MYAEPGIRIAGHFVTSVEFLAVAALLLAVAAILIGYRRELRTTIKPSVATDQLTGNLARIADALERIASRPIGATLPETARRTEPGTRVDAPAEKTVAETEPAGEEAHRVAYSLFGR